MLLKCISNVEYKIKNTAIQYDVGIQVGKECKANAVLHLLLAFGRRFATALAYSKTVERGLPSNTASSTEI